MSTPMNPGAESARENARQDNGQFGTQHRPEAIVDLLPGVVVEPRPDLPADLAQLAFLIDDLESRDQYHSGSMLRHHSASDCGTCVAGDAYAQVRDMIDGHERLGPDLDTKLERLSSGIAHLRSQNDQRFHSGNMLPHASASDCTRCLRESALRKVAAKVDATAAAVEARPDFSSVDRQWKDACEGYAARYAPAPQRTDEPIDGYDNSHIVPASELAVGHRLADNRLVTSVDTSTPGVVHLGLDAGASDHLTVSTDERTLIHDARVDLTDPDWFEFEAHRITAATFEERHPDGAARQSDYDAVATEVRRSLTRAVQPTNISPLHNDDIRAANGRAKVGDDVVFSQPMWGETAYRVIGKVPRVDILGHDGTNVVWGETGEVEYVIKDLYTGHQSTSNLRDRGYRRIPAPGDIGPGAQVIAQSAPRRGPEDATAPGYRSMEHQLNEGFGV